MKMKKKKLKSQPFMNLEVYNGFIEENEFVQHMGNCLNLML